MYVAIKHNDFHMVMYHLQYGGKKPHAQHHLSQNWIAKVKAIASNMPHIMHVLVKVMVATCIVRIININLHPFYIVLDYAKDLEPMLTSLSKV